MKRVFAERARLAPSHPDVKHRSIGVAERTDAHAKASFHGTPLSIGIESERMCGLINIPPRVSLVHPRAKGAEITGIHRTLRLADESNVGVLIISSRLVPKRKFKKMKVPPPGKIDPESIEFTIGRSHDRFITMTLPVCRGGLVFSARSRDNEVTRSSSPIYPSCG